MTSTQRQLAAILFADIVGYTALMGANEDQAFRALERFKSIALPVVKQYRGRWHKDLGDGALCSFGSALDAVYAAIVIQQSLNQDGDFRVRMGIHLGDTTFKNGDLFGDGVNVASRIQSLAAAGGICISESVYKSVRNKEGITTMAIGKKSLKNVPERLRLYQIKAPGVVHRAKKEPRKIPLLLAVALTLFLSALTGLGVWFLRSSPEAAPAALKKYHLVLPDDAPLEFVGFRPLATGYTALALSPDGKKLVYVAGREGTTWLYIRSQDDFEVRPLPATENAYYPFFSPDGQQIGFFADDKLKKISLDGSEPVVLCPASNAVGAFWTTDNRIYVANSNGNQVFSIDANGGQPQFPPIDIAGSLAWPFILPGNKYMLASSLSNRFLVYLVELATGEVTTLPIRGMYVRYLPTGHLLHNLKDRLFCTPFNLEKLEVSGPTIPLIDRLRTEMTLDAPQYAVSQNGMLVYAPGTSADIAQMVWVDLSGREEVLDFAPDYYGMISISPDRTKLAVSYTVLEADIWINDLISGRRSRLTTEGDNYAPTWLPDNKTVLFRTSEGNHSAIFAKRLSDHRVQSFFQDSLPVSYAVVSSDSTWLALQMHRRTTLSDIWLKNLREDHPARPFIVSKGYDRAFKFSPDGHYLAYTSDESGKYEVYLQALSATGDRLQISDNGGEEPVWAPSGESLYYRDGKKWLEVKLERPGSLRAGSPKLLFERPYLNAPWYSYDIDPNGERFLVLKATNEGHDTQVLQVIENWFDEIRRLAPGR